MQEITNDTKIQNPINPPIPYADKEIKFVQKKKKYMAFKIIIVLELVVIAVLSFLLFYLFEIRKNVTVEYKDEFMLIEDNSISKIEAEIKNLEMVNKQPKSLNDLDLSSYYSNGYFNYYSFPLIDNAISNNVVKEHPKVSLNTLEIQKDGILKEVNIELKNNLTNQGAEVIDRIYITKDVREDVLFQNNTLVNNIKNYIEQKNLEVVELDISMTYYSNYLELLQNLNSDLVEDTVEVEIITYLYPKWGNEINYINFQTISNQFHRNMNLSELNSVVDKVKVLAFDYTGPLDILPGPITPKDWFERIIQYYIHEGIERDKLEVGINTNAYIWPEREIAIDTKDNYSVLELEADAMTFNNFQNFIAQNGIAPETVEGMNEKIYRYIFENERKIAVFPSTEYIESLVQLTAEYGISGMFFK